MRSDDAKWFAEANKPTDLSAARPVPRHPLLAQADLQRIIAEGRNRLMGGTRGHSFVWERPSKAALIKPWTHDQTRMELQTPSVDWPYQHSDRSRTDIELDSRSDAPEFLSDLLRPSTDEDARASVPDETDSDRWGLLGDYYRRISQVELFSAEQEVSISKRVEIGLFASERLAEYLKL